MRKFIILTIFGAAIAATSGCALQKAKGWDQYGKYMAAYDVLSADCLAINENDRDYINYRIAASKLLTVMELDSDLYNNTYKTIYTKSRSNTREENMEWCEKLRPTIVIETEGMEGDYQLGLKVVEISRRERAETWARALEATAAIATAVGEGMQAANQQAAAQYRYIPMPLNQPSFNNNQKSGTPIYNSSECIGAVVSGRCAGTINPSPSNVLRKKCYGTMINGECKGVVDY
ncbi:hypothetical protein [Acinetobacter towneri]|uniref:hypothetical protein n=1 Tax=Acinetobacter towneri TaxID=202956 RepID=UPI001F455769|nr:hypothetical protein [Acinetobacter towneri]UIP24104.1 hypothetical protein LZG54_07825 [Acinetobacter towneri]